MRPSDRLRAFDDRPGLAQLHGTEECRHLREPLRSEIFTGLMDRGIAGFREIQLLRRDRGDEVEFVTVMWLGSLDAVRAFAAMTSNRRWCLWPDRLSWSASTHAPSIINSVNTER